MYVQGFVVQVAEGKKDAYRDMANKFWPIVKDLGAVEHVEVWEADVPDGQQTDFRRAVNLEAGEKVVFSWITWPDKETADASRDKMMADPRMQEMDMENLPFDAKRMIYGGFEPLVKNVR